MKILQQTNVFHRIPHSLVLDLRPSCSFMISAFKTRAVDIHTQSLWKHKRCNFVRGCYVRSLHDCPTCRKKLYTSQSIVAQSPADARFFIVHSAFENVCVHSITGLAARGALSSIRRCSYKDAALHELESHASRIQDFVSYTAIVQHVHL